MYRSVPMLALLTCAVLAAMGTQTASAVAPIEIRAQALDTRPQSRFEGDEALDGAVAAAVIGAVGNQFGEQQVAVKLDQVAVVPASPQDRSVSGEGRLQIGAEPQWIPFRFSALYDTVATSVSYPRLKIGGHLDGREIASDSTIAKELSAQVDAALGAEFQGQGVDLALDRITTHGLGKRYLQVSAQGTADFGAEGTTAAQVEGMYDRRNGHWVRVDYELGGTSNWADSNDEPVAVR